MIASASATGVRRSVTYGTRTIAFTVLHTSRKTMEIAVHPDGEVVVTAPQDADAGVVDKKVKKRARWILKQIAYFGQFAPRTPARCYISGESHLYLGKHYRLTITTGPVNEVKLLRGRFYIICRDPASPELVKELLRQWYLAKATAQFSDSIDRCWPKFSGLSLPRPELAIRTMKKRWGSLTESGIIALNVELLKAPKACIDYVVVHELCHLKHYDHSPEFYQMLDAVMPDWEKVKHRLELSLA